MSRVDWAEFAHGSSELNFGSSPHQICTPTREPQEPQNAVSSTGDGRRKADGAVEYPTPIDCDNASTLKAVQGGDTSSEIDGGSSRARGGVPLTFPPLLCQVQKSGASLKNLFPVIPLLIDSADLDTPRSTRTHKAPSPILLHRHQPLISSLS